MSTSTGTTSGGCPVRSSQGAQVGLAELGFDHLDPDLGEPSLWATYQALLDGPPVHRSDRHGGFWVLTRHADVKRALRDWQTFSSADGHRIPHVPGMGTIPIDYDPPAHTAYRDLVMQALRPDRVREMLPFVTTTIDDLVDGLVARGGGDVVVELALPLPLTMLQEIVGFSADAVAQFRALTVAVWADGTQDGQLLGRRALADLLDAEIERHRTERPDDYLTWLIDAEVDGRPVRRDEVISALLSLAVAGHETTQNSVGTLLYLLGRDPSLQAKLRDDPDLAPRYVEEMLRLRTPSQASARRLTADVTIDGTEMRAGDWVMLLSAAANRDPEKFEHPDEFDIDRDARGHLAFGWGIHQCVGAAFARMELTQLLRKLTTVPAFTLDGEPAFSALQAGNHYGLTCLPITFEEK